MSVGALESIARTSVGREAFALAEKLFPLCRSLTGDGVRETLRIVSEIVPFEIHEIPSGTSVFDWSIPDEWNIRDGWIKNPRGEKIVDFREHNLHVLQYSVPVHRKLPLAELKKHLFTLPDRPDWIPYRTSFFDRNWGFCLRHSDLLELEEGEYEVRIDASLAAGHLTYGEYYLPGDSTDEVLIYSHCCHPSLANDNLSGLALLTLLARELQHERRRLSYRFVLAPGNVGAIAWLALNESRTARLRHGLVLACVGGPGDVHYKKSRRGNAVVDRAAALVLRESGHRFHLRDFSPYGYAERQFCSPGFNLPVGCFMRTPHGEFPEYHTSADNLDYLQPEFLDDSWAKLREIVRVLDGNRTFLNQNARCEPRLGARGLYSSVGGDVGRKDWEMALLWLLNLSDGDHSLLDIAERSGVRFPLLETAADALERCGLLAPALA
jgi:aminopeptidase-like protein